MGRRPVGEVGGQVVGMKFTHEFHLAINFANDKDILEFFVGMKFLAVVLNPFCDKERELAASAVRAEGGDAKEGRELVRHSQRFDR